MLYDDSDTYRKFIWFSQKCRKDSSQNQKLIIIILPNPPKDKMSMSRTVTIGASVPGPTPVYPEGPV